MSAFRTRSTFRTSLLAGAFLLAFGGLASAAQPGVALHSFVQPSADIKSGANGTITFNLTNHGASSLFIQRSQLPVAGMPDNLFEVRLNGRAVDYIGPDYKRVDAASLNAGDYVELRPGQTHTVEVNLSDAYDLSQSGMYEVRFRGQLADAFAEHTERAARFAPVERMDVRADANYLWVDGMAVSMHRYAQARAQLPTDWMAGPTAAIGYTSCSTSQKNALPSALSAAQNYATNASNYLNAGTHNARYTTWFGSYTSSRFNTVKSHYTNIKDAVYNQPIAFDCSCTDSGTYAYVYPTQPYKIYVCGAFWSAPNTGTDSRGGTIIHETSHFNVVAGTQDYAYGQSAAKKLATNTPSKAIANADNHEYFAENTPFQN